MLGALRRIKGVREVTQQARTGAGTGGGGQSATYTLHISSGQDLRDEVSRAVISSGWSLLSMQMVGMSLEDIFLRLTTHEEL